VAQKERCCQEHYELGSCQPGQDDKAPSGKCYAFCKASCYKGGFCKANGNKHHCHCYC
ncbi:hypothetical protein Tsubulata_008779, partial [Turnera subulata]